MEKLEIKEAVAEALQEYVEKNKSNQNNIEQDISIESPQEINIRRIKNGFLVGVYSHSSNQTYVPDVNALCEYLKEKLLIKE